MSKYSKAEAVKVLGIDLAKEVFHLHGLYQELLHPDQRIAEYDDCIARLAKQSAACQRVISIPGIGPLTATTLVAAVGDAKLLGISKRGYPYLRRLLIHGARAVLRIAPRKHDRRSRWATSLLERKHVNVTAMANKNVRTAWALLTQCEMFDSAAA